MHWLLWVDLLDMGFVKGSESDCAHTYGTDSGLRPSPHYFHLSFGRLTSTSLKKKKMSDEISTSAVL